MTLSIIIPIYNAERYFRECIESILNQSYCEWEVIVINDGSSDNTRDLLDEYQKRDGRIKVFHKENEGVAIARNVGLKQATGDYTLFCDADDVMLPEALQAIADNLKQNPVDYLRYEFKTIDAQGHDIYPNYEAKRRQKYAGKTVDAATCITDIVRSEFFLWSGAFNKQIIEEHYLTFLESCTYNEDTLFMLRFFCNSKTHSYLASICYGYRKYDGAVTAKFTEKNFRDVMDVFKNIMLNLPTERRLHEAVRSIGERLGRRLIEASRMFKDDDITYEVERLCCENPVTIDWKMYNYLGRKPWIVLDVIRKIIRKF